MTPATEKIVVFDESGTGSTPGDLERAHEFSCCGLMFEEGDVQHLRALHATLANLTSNGDFKFSDVRKSAAATLAFQRGIGSSNCSLIALHFAPQSVSLEQRRFEAVYSAQHGQPPAGYETQPRTHHDNLMEVVKIAAATFIVRPFERHTVYWDARSDGPAIEHAWNESMRQVRAFGLVDPRRELPRLSVGPPNALKFAARLAGVVAGDLVAFFRNCSRRVYPLLRPAFSLSRPITDIVGAAKVADGRGDLIQPGLDDTGPARTLLRGYYWRLLSRHVFFYDPHGRGCGITIHKNHVWHVSQVPDRAPIP
ncbi:MAG: hypothetical protein JNL08_00935 [Planctomycetes bacterium]|nr:hypothetical protein [Planctomycetota bacterium]